MVVFSTAIGLFTRASLKELLTETAAHAVPALGYLDYDQRKGLVLGHLNALLDHLEEKAGVRYKDVHLIGYSFGSIVALDALFPLQEPSPRLSRVTTLTTIGSPFDFMRTYWPGYFTKRKGAPDKPARWINIYSPMDIMGSDFRDVTGDQRLRGVQLASDTERKPDVTVLYGRERTLSLGRPFEYFALAGFRVHAHYWEKMEEGGVDCFDDIVRELYKGHAALA